MEFEYRDEPERPPELAADLVRRCGHFAPGTPTEATAASLSAVKTSREICHGLDGHPRSVDGRVEQMRSACRAGGVR